MVKGKILQVTCTLDYYIFEELVYNGRKFVLGAVCDIKNDLINTNQLFVQEIKYIDNKLIASEIQDQELAKTVTEKLLELYRTNGGSLPKTSQ